MNIKLIIPFLFLLTACGGGGGGGDGDGGGNNGGGNGQNDDDSDPEMPVNNWGEPVRLSSIAVDGALDVSLALDPAGNAVAVWSQYFFGDEYAQYQAAASYLSVGQAEWSAPETIHGMEDARYVDTPKVEFDANGNAIAIWDQDMRDDDDLIRMNRYVFGMGWGMPQDLQTSPGSFLPPALAVAPSGEGIAVWGVGYDTIWTSFYSPEDGWVLPPTEIPGTTRISPYSHDVAIDSSGIAFVVWRQSDDESDDLPDVMVSRYNAIEWSTPVRLEAGGPDLDADDPKIGMDSAGNAIAIWRAFEGDQINIYFNRYTVSGGWEAPERLATGTWYELAVSANGSAVAIWRAANNINLRAAVFSPASGWGDPVTVDAKNNSIDYQKVAMNDFGDAVVVWSQSDGTRDSIWSNHYKAGEGWGGAILVEQHDDAGGYRPVAVIDNAGNAIAAWDEYPHNGNQVWVNRYIND